MHITDTSKELLSCFNNIPFVLCIVIAFIIVLSGTVMNCVFWKRKNGKQVNKSILSCYQDKKKGV